MTIKMFPSTHDGKPCFAVQIGSTVKKFRSSDGAAQFIVNQFKKGN